MKVCTKTSEIYGQIAEIMKTAKEKLWIVCPFIDHDIINPVDLEIKQKKGLEIKILSRFKFQEDEQKQAETDIIWNKKRFPQVQLYSNAHIHAKCILNERIACVLTRNFQKYSSTYNDSNFDIAVTFYKNAKFFQEAEETSYHRIGSYVRPLFREGDEIKPDPEPEEPKASESEEAKASEPEKVTASK